MKAEYMTTRERWRAALRLQPVDRLPFWPKIYGAYAKARTGRHAGATADALHAFIGSDRHEWVHGCARDVRRQSRVEVESHGNERRIRFETPVGVVCRVEHYDGPSDSWHPIEMPVKTADDIRILTAFYEDCQPEFDAGGKTQAQDDVARWGEAASTCSGIGESPLMEWIEHLAGVENGHYLLADRTAEVETLFAAMHRVLLRRAEIEFEHTPADMVYLVENTSTTLISPSQYRAYCLPFIAAYAGIARRHGKCLVLHMCGYLKNLLPDLARLPVAAFEALTSPPVGNTTLPMGRTACPDTCLIGGTNATLWLQPAKTIIGELERDLAALSHHRGIVVTSAGVMPPTVEPETIRDVCRWVQSVPFRLLPTGRDAQRV